MVTLPAVPHKVAETLSHSAISVGHVVARRRPDAALLFNAANAPFLPALRARRIPVATHVDGLEWKRAKWSGAGQKYYRAAESLAVRHGRVDGVVHAEAELLSTTVDRDSVR